MKKVLGLIGLFVLALMLVFSDYAYSTPVRVDDDVGITLNMDVDKEIPGFTEENVYRISQSVADPLMIEYQIISVVDPFWFFDLADVQGTNLFSDYTNVYLPAYPETLEINAFDWQLMCPG